jgi:SAM-dependent methyltransferase
MGALVYKPRQSIAERFFLPLIIANALLLTIVLLGTCDESTTLLATSKDNHTKVGFQGGAWTAETHLREHGFNVDWGLMEVLEASCREIENERNKKEPWKQYTNPDPMHPLTDWWIAPPVCDCKVLEVGCGVGVYVDGLKTTQAKSTRQVFGIEPNPMKGTFERQGGPKQIAVDMLQYTYLDEYAKILRDQYLKGDYFDLIYSIGKYTHAALILITLSLSLTHNTRIISSVQRYLNTCHSIDMSMPQPF